jgi:hypothetical protein
MSGDNLRTAPSGPFIRGTAPGQVLTWDGSSWVAESPSSGGEDAAVVPFTFTSGVVALALIVPGQTLYRADILIETPFDGPLAKIQVGTAAIPGLVLGPNDSIPSMAAQYESLAMIVFPAVDNLILTVTSGGSTQGSGRLLYELRR